MERTDLIGVSHQRLVVGVDGGVTASFQLFWEDGSLREADKDTTPSELMCCGLGEPSRLDDVGANI